MVAAAIYQPRRPCVTHDVFLSSVLLVMSTRGPILRRMCRDAGCRRGTQWRALIERLETKIAEPQSSTSMVGTARARR